MESQALDADVLMPSQVVPSFDRIPSQASRTLSAAVWAAVWMFSQVCFPDALRGSLMFVRNHSAALLQARFMPSTALAEASLISSQCLTTS